VKTLPISYSEAFTDKRTDILEYITYTLGNSTYVFDDGLIRYCGQIIKQEREFVVHLYRLLLSTLTFVSELLLLSNYAVASTIQEINMKAVEKLKEILQQS
jgi:hypothetical protein